MDPVGDDELRALMERLDVLLREHQDQRRCCHTDCLHCPFRSKDRWIVTAAGRTPPSS